MAKEIGKGTVDGIVSGAMEGVGRGLLTDEDLLKTTLQDAAIGTVLGAGGGVVGANAQKAKRALELKSESDIKKLRKKETGFYNSTLQKKFL